VSDTRASLSTPLLTHELGSLDKPGWRVKANAGAQLEEGDVEEARAWGERLQVPDYQDLLELLARSPLDGEQRAEVRRWSSRYGLRLLESAGLDVVYDGEQQRSEMYAWAVAHADGFEWRGSVRAFDNKYYSKAAHVAPRAVPQRRVLIPQLDRPLNAEGPDHRPIHDRRLVLRRALLQEPGSRTSGLRAPAHAT